MTAAPDGAGTEAKALREAFGTFATGVTIVTVGGAMPHGMTANSFSSVSLDPPLVLVCVDRTAVMHGVLGAAEHFGVSVLAGDQEGVARHFATRRRGLGASQFESVDWWPGPLTGVPLISGALASLECELWRGYDGGDHTIFVGRVTALRRGAGADALLFHGGKLRRMAPLISEVRT
ncbi:MULTISPECIES: flavin reductase family protein [Actinomadura]|uniref:Flavin reductase n=1 Tax=Actinomadura litoris TaxID=2678616 RepID=A0A7K1L9V4_9ACTN|nr:MULTISPECIES: flavin reductase family protein [Actinomadura]MBT2212819.1 flavin reductase family protein [Actinomadura sp. NEAU-AAG7]MUN40985.1 flavin reductase [Actinomadura litoris]